MFVLSNCPVTPAPRGSVSLASIGTYTHTHTPLNKGKSIFIILLGDVVLAFNPKTSEAEAGMSLSSRPAWSIQWVPGQPGPLRYLVLKKKKKIYFMHASVMSACMFVYCV